MERVWAQAIVAETSDHARQKVEEQERIVASMRISDPRLPKAIVALQVLQRSLVAAELNEAFA